MRIDLSVAAGSAPIRQSPSVDVRWPPHTPTLTLVAFVPDAGHLQTALATVLDPLIAAGRIAAWCRHPTAPLCAASDYHHPHIDWPEVDLTGWIDHLGLIRLMPGVVPGRATQSRQAQVRAALLGCPHAATHQVEARAVVVQVLPPPAPANEPGVVCRCGHIPADHLLRDCTGWDRSGLVCPCTRFRSKHSAHRTTTYRSSTRGPADPVPPLTQSIGTEPAGEETIWDEADCCTLCGTHVSEPHGKDCPRTGTAGTAR